MTKQKKTILQATLLILTALLLCTVISKVVYKKLLPIVESVKPSRNIITIQSVAGASVMNVTEQAQDTAPTEWTVKEVYASAGEEVQKGTPLFQIDMLEYTARLRQMQADIQEQQNYINATDWTGGDRLVLNTKLEATRLEYQRMTGSGTPQNGIITATHDGTIHSLLASPGARLSAYQTYVEYELATQQQRVVWSMSKAAGPRYLDVGRVTISSTDSKAENDGLPLELEVVVKKQQEDLSWRYQALLPPEMVLDSAQSYQATMVLKENTYDHVVPRSCVQTDQAGQNFIYIVTEEEGLFSKKYTVSTKTVVLLDEDNLHAAIRPRNSEESLNGCEIVVSTSKPIRDGGEVALKAVA